MRETFVSAEINVHVKAQLGTFLLRTLPMFVVFWFFLFLLCSALQCCFLIPVLRSCCESKRLCSPLAVVLDLQCSLAELGYCPEYQTSWKMAQEN